MKTNADVRPWVVTVLATAYLIAFWAFSERAPSKRAPTAEARAPVATAARATPVTRGRIRTRSS